MGEYYVWYSTRLYFRNPLLFNIFFRDLVLKHEDSCFTNYADDKTPYMTAGNTTEVIGNLTSFTKNLFTWFTNNQMRENPMSLTITNTQEEANMQIPNTTMKCFKSKNNFWEYYLIIS